MVSRPATEPLTGQHAAPASDAPDLADAGSGPCEGLPDAGARGAPKPIDPRLVAALNRFSFELYAKTREADKNLILSPASAAVALSMVMAGAVGPTESEMKNTLHLAGFADPHWELGALVDVWNAQDGQEGTSLRIQERVWPQQGVRLLAPFVSLMQERYHAPLEPVDFLRRDEAAAQINGWASRATCGRIRSIVGRDDLDDAKLVITNAVYFKDAWQDPFPARATKEAFFSAPSGPVRAKLMHRVATVPYRRVAGGQVVVLPYRGALSMVIALPDDAAGLAAIEKALVADRGAWFKGFSPTSVDLILPRWKAETETKLNGALTDLGMGRAFSDGAQFSGLGGRAAPHQRRPAKSVH